VHGFVCERSDFLCFLVWSYTPGTTLNGLLNVLFTSFSSDSPAHDAGMQSLAVCRSALHLL
jgi:hypothetical protein